MGHLNIFFMFAESRGVVTRLMVAGGVVASMLVGVAGGAVCLTVVAWGWS